MVRDIITIDEDLCTGCGDCVPGCPEGALRIIDGKARLVGDSLCDGLGACIGNCPTGALVVERREAEAYDEASVMVTMIEKGRNTVLAHLEHLSDHGETELLNIALSVLGDSDWDKKDDVLASWQNREDAASTEGAGHACACGGHGHGHDGCPGSASQSFGAERENAAAGAVTAAMAGAGPLPSALSHWPVQMHLMNPVAPHFTGSDFVLAADCTAFSFGAFHRDFLEGKTLGIACPKLDSGLESYVEKVRDLIDDARINTLTVIMMQVPCCGGLLQIAKIAAQQAQRKVPIKQIIVGIQGEILSEDWV